MSSGDLFTRLQAALADRYAVERELGSGGMATVYLAEDLKHRRRVAVKVLRPELAAALGAERFLREIEIAAGLHHPHILPLYDSGRTGADEGGRGRTDEFLYYVMPYVEGESLRDRLAREKQLPLEDALLIAREVADALSYAHARGLVHRDIKPENILLESGHAMVADFGIARAVDAAGGEQLTETGLAIGTPTYMSPEQAAGERDLDGRSDLYALGCVLYEMLAGQPPFTGPTVESVIRQHLTAPPPAITQFRPAVPPDVVGMLERALAKTPADRFSPAAAFAEAIRRTAQSPTLTQAPVPPAPAHRPRRWAALAGALAVVAVAVLLLTRPWTGGPASTDPKAIAVLPLENLSGGEENAFFAAGVHEEILTYLAKVRDLRVIARSTVMPYAGRAAAAGDVARDLGVGYVMEGSVRRAGNQVRVTVQLIDAGTSQQLWADTFDGPLTDVFAIQSTIAQEIVRALRANLSPKEAERLAERPTESVEAYDLYLRARALGTAPGISMTDDQEVVQLLEAAVQADPGFAVAWAALGEARTALYWPAPGRTPELLAAAKEAIDRAFALRPGLPEAHYALATYYYRGFYDYPRALEQLEIARAGFPGSTDVIQMLGLTLRRVGRFEESVDAFEEAAELDPASLAAKGDAFWTAVNARLWDRAATLSERLAREYPRNGTFAGMRAMMLLYGYGDTAAARREIAMADPAEEFYSVDGMFYTALYGRRPAEALAVVRAHADVIDVGVAGSAEVYAAQSLLAAGDTAAARRELTVALRRLEVERANPVANTWPHTIAGLAYGLAGDGPRAREACARAREVLPESKDKVHAVSAAGICAMALALVGDTDTALTEIARLLRTPWGLTAWQLALDPGWDFLRGDPRFRALAAAR